MLDLTRETFEVFKEVVNLPPGQIFCAGTPKDNGFFFEEIWLFSDKKEWNGKEWIPTNADADLQISGYHITQEFSSFVTPEQLEYKRKNMTPRMFINEVLAQFFAADGSDLLLLTRCYRFLCEALRNSATQCSRKKRWVLTLYPAFTISSKNA